MKDWLYQNNEGKGILKFIIHVNVKKRTFYTEYQMIHLFYQNKQRRMVYNMTFQLVLIKQNVRRPVADQITLEKKGNSLN